MTFFRLKTRALAITLAAATLAGVAGISMRPKPIESAMLGAAWQCSRSAFVITTCAPRPVPAVQTVQKGLPRV